jgi:sulfur-oxidizing protein SoxX
VSLLVLAPAFAEDYVPWRAENYAIEAPLGGLRGDAARGRVVVASREQGNCLACHQLPIPEEPSHGTIGPPLIGVGARLSEGALRLRVVDQKQVNPATIMPAFYLHPEHLHRPRPDLVSTILTAQEVEDVVAYLMTLR